MIASYLKPAESHKTIYDPFYQNEEMPQEKSFGKAYSYR